MSANQPEKKTNGFWLQIMTLEVALITGGLLYLGNSPTFRKNLQGGIQNPRGNQGAPVQKQHPRGDSTLDSAPLSDEKQMVRADQKTEPSTRDPQKEDGWVLELAAHEKGANQEAKQHPSRGPSKNSFRALTVPHSTKTRTKASGHPTIPELTIENDGLRDLKKGRPGRAIPYFTHKLMQTGEDPTSYFYRALAYEQLALSENARSDYNRAMEMDPDQALYPFYLATLEFRQKNFQKAASLFQEAAHIDPLLAEAHLNAGISLEKQKEFHLATTEYRRAIQKKESLQDAHVHLIENLLHTERPLDALAAMEQARTQISESADLDYLEGEIYRSLADNEMAVIFYKRALSKNQEHSDAWNQLALVLKQMGRWEESRLASRMIDSREKSTRAPEFDGASSPENPSDHTMQASRLEPEFERVQTGGSVEQLDAVLAHPGPIPQEKLVATEEEVQDPDR